MDVFAPIFRVFFAERLLLRGLSLHPLCWEAEGSYHVNGSSFGEQFYNQKIGLISLKLGFITK